MSYVTVLSEKPWSNIVVDMGSNERVDINLYLWDFKVSMKFFKMFGHTP